MSQQRDPPDFEDEAVRQVPGRSATPTSRRQRDDRGVRHMRESARGASDRLSSHSFSRIDDVDRAGRRHHPNGVRARPSSSGSLGTDAGRRILSAIARRSGRWPGGRSNEHVIFDLEAWRLDSDARSSRDGVFTRLRDR